MSYEENDSNKAKGTFWKDAQGYVHVRRIVGISIPGVAVFIMIIVLLASSIFTVDAGNVKVLTEWGRTTGVTFYPGLHAKIPFKQNVTNYSTRQIIYEVLMEEKVKDSRADFKDYVVKTTSSDGQQVTLNYTIVFSIDGKGAEWLLNNIGDMNDVVEKVIKAESRSLARNIPKKYTAAQMYSGDVFKLQEELRSILKGVFLEKKILLDDFLLREITFEEAYLKVLEDKQTNKERIAVEENILKQEEIKKQQVIVQAEAEAQKIIIKSEALKNNQDYLKLTFIEKLATNIRWGILPQSDVIPFLDILKVQEQSTETNGQ
jgi:regulator of protease activity HflC (stomatin/prohibitin superfamily)